MYSNKLSKSTLGHNKDGDDTDQINVLFVTDQNTGMPVYYRTYSGQIPDASTIKFFLQKNARIKLEENAVFIADKGYSSIINLHRFYQSKASFLLNMRTSYSMCKNFVRENIIELNDPCNYVPSIGNSVVTTEINWSYPVNFKTNCKGRVPKLKAPMFAHVFYSREIYNQAQQNLTHNIGETIQCIYKGKTLTSFQQNIKDRFLIEKEDGSFATNRANYDNYMEMKGIRVLVSDTVKDPLEAYKAYYDRNEVEYNFNIYKQRLGCNRARVSDERALEGKAFVQFIATAIAVIFRKRLQQTIKAGFRFSYSSDGEVLTKLNSITQTKFEFGSYYSETVGKIRELLDAMNIPIPDGELASDYEYDSDLEAIAEERAYYEINDELDLDITDVERELM